MKRTFQRGFPMGEVIGLLLVLVFGIPLYAWAATTGPNTFTANTPAKAGEVNDNFNALATAIDTISLTPGPKGDKGDTGATGATGPQGPQGPAGADGSPDTADQVRDKFFAGTSCAGNSAGDIMVKVGPLCVDKYEASVWSNADGTGTHYGDPNSPFSLTAYPAGFPANGNWTTPVYAVSKTNVLPSTNLSWFQAQQACALSGKRLLTNAEWQMAAAGTPTTYEPGADNGTTNCNTSTAGAPVNTGSRSACVSKWGVNDMVGNVWEWVADWMHGGSITWAASSGSAGTDYGIDIISAINPAVNQGTNSSHFPAALVRGGSWINGSDAGVFAMQLDYAPTLSSALIRTGFRCGR
jgi:formylglycine-generating enzyme required for sulfatase activity